MKKHDIDVDFNAFADAIEKTLDKIYGEKMVFFLNVAPANAASPLNDYASNIDINDLTGWLRSTLIHFENKKDQS